MLSGSVVEPGSSIAVAADIEPSFLALGPFHLALGMNNRAWFYLLGETNVDLLRDREYLGTVSDMQLNADYCAVRYEGKIQLHVLESDGVVTEERESRIFPEPGRPAETITCMALTPEFLVWGTEQGGLTYFLLEDWTTVTEFKHVTGIRALVAEPGGTRVAFIDARNQGGVYQPGSEAVVAVPDLPESTKTLLWDQCPGESHVLAAWDGTAAHTLVLDTERVAGPAVRGLGSTRVPLGQHPILLYNGELTLQTQSGKLVRLVLASHDIAHNIGDFSPAELRSLLDKNLALGRFSNGWAICELLDEREGWEQLGRAALQQLEVELAIRVYRQLREVSLVWSLSSVRGLEDRALLAGHLAMVLGDYTLAQQLYLQSSRPVEALHMRRDLLQWDQALALADRLAPDEIPTISREFAQQLEFTGDYPGALQHYERGLAAGQEGEHAAACRAGMARMSLRCGELRRGLQLAGELQSRQLLRECAEILESMKQLAEAAQLYESAQYHDKAAQLYIKLKNWTKIGQLLPHISSPKIQLQFARAKEADGKYKEAVAAYEAARDWDSAVRLYLDRLNDPENAVRIVRQTRSNEGAKMVARFFLKLNDFSSAIQFLVISRCVDEAFQLAQQHAKMDLFADIVGEDATPEDNHSIAVYFETERNHLQAGRFYQRAGEHGKALRHLLRVAATSQDQDNQAINLAIEVVGTSGQAHLARQLIEFLMGETDGVPKDAKFLFRLYMARQQYKEAAKTAVIIAREEQAAGNYRNAHDVLFNMYQVACDVIERY